ncbi:pyrroline-5-carboxylate reductase [Vaginisenegalia massiliensis]|uniref:pyrroline-5-carboxylate reductase n=1 Tax=Vaginisenegalia massiliensis TaxID=2058294 RepID=UPI000F52CA87|nr:pyrroline-5-carboxylate reductase [Vaginisenegalia massiliensis]
MRKHSIGFIGVGKMGSAIASAVRKQEVDADFYFNSAPSDYLTDFAKQMSASICDKESLINQSEVIFIGVKPKDIQGVMNEIKGFVSEKEPKLWISMATGVDLALLTSLLPKHHKVIRIMPNTPVAVGQGYIAYCINEAVKQADVVLFEKLLACAGLIEPVEESLFDATSAITGCGPAYMYLVMEALSDGGVKNGLSRQQANRMAQQLLIGAGHLAQESNQHFGQLKDDVCSPAGSTIAGQASLEAHGVRSAFIHAVDAAVERTKEIAQSL